MMGLRTSAAKLGFRLAAATSDKKICGSGRILRFTSRSNSSLATVGTTTAIAEKSSNLYLCFDERRSYSKTQLSTNLVVRPISLVSCDDGREKELRDDAAHRFSDMKDTTNSLGYSKAEKDDEEIKFRRGVKSQTKIIRSASDILFTVGQTSPRDIGWVDPSIHPVKFHVSSQSETKIKSFSNAKSDMRWGFIDDKLYCFDNCPALSPSLEVLDPETDDTKWQRLSEPPFIQMDGVTDRYSVLFLNGSKKILGWEDEKRGVFCFDAAKPEDGWMETPSSIGDYVPFIGEHDTRLVIRDNHPELGDFNLMFSYDRFNEPFLINPYFISDKCDSFQLIDEPILLSKHSCSSYRVGYPESLERWRKPGMYFDSQFVQLGSRKFCLVMHKFIEENFYSEQSTAEGKILVITFEYDVIASEETKDSEPPLEIKTQMLGTRRFHYSLSKTRANSNDMIGAFLF